MQSSKGLNEAAKILEETKATSLSDQVRQERSVQLAALMLQEANRTQTFKEKRLQSQLARMMNDPVGKAFTTAMTDECFRSKRPSRVAAQMVYLLSTMGAPKYLSLVKRLQLKAFQYLGRPLAHLFVPLAIFMLRKETSSVILSGEKQALKQHMRKRREQGVRINLNHLGEAILGEKEAEKRLKVYLEDLKNDEVEYVSIKISTIYSQINLLSWEETKAKVADKLRELYRVAKDHKFRKMDGSVGPKFVNLDMEEYRDLELTKEIFMMVLEEEEFKNFSAGIVLQAYLPDSHLIQKELTEWAQERMRNGGAPIKIRIVKGANLAMEQFEASLNDWEQAPYTQKLDVDANYKRMLCYGIHNTRAKAVNLGIGSHNLFDIAYAMLLRAEQEVEDEVCFEMLEGMADHIRRVVHHLSGSMLLYCPVATKEDFQSAIAYLIRRLDENTGADNFLRHTFGLKPNTAVWDEQVKFFQLGCQKKDSVFLGARRIQDRHHPLELPSFSAHFENESNTDFSLKANRVWLEKHLENWKKVQLPPIPLMIDGKAQHENKPQGVGVDPKEPKKEFYRYSLATESDVDRAVASAKAYEGTWKNKSVEERCRILHKAAQIMREKRGDLIGAMMRDGGKTAFESDPEISEAIDFAEYYKSSMLQLTDHNDIEWQPRGTILVTPPWNFPCAIPFGGMAAALVTGNCVLFKPAPEVVLTGWMTINALWDAGVPKEALQFINCEDDPVGSKLIADPRINGIILTGATATAKLFLRINPKLHLNAETGGKNALIISSMSDRDLAIKDLLHSAFGHSGQKCSAASLCILEAEVYDDPHFRAHLKDAVESLSVGDAWNQKNKVIPLIREPSEQLLRGLTQLDEGEEWLVKPKQDPHNPNLWSPGVRWGVKEGSFTHETELFGPVLGVMRARNLEHALQLANHTPYGLTAGLHTLDTREHKVWAHSMEAGNLYINRTTTGAVVQRQPFGGTKASCFGHGAKAGGPNYLTQFMHARQVDVPLEKMPVGRTANNLTQFLSKKNLHANDLGLWYASIASYTYWGEKFSHKQDKSLLVGQDNFFYQVPRKNIIYRIQRRDTLTDILRIICAAIAARCPLEVSWSSEQCPVHIDKERWSSLIPECRFVKEEEERFLKRVRAGEFSCIRLASEPSDELLTAAHSKLCHVAKDPVLANGRFELLHYLREVSLSVDYHRYGNLGLREKEPRKAIK